MKDYSITTKDVERGLQAVAKELEVLFPADETGLAEHLAKFGPGETPLPNEARFRQKLRDRLNAQPHAQSPIASDAAPFEAPQAEDEEEAGE